MLYRIYKHNALLEGEAPIATDITFESEEEAKRYCDIRNAQNPWAVHDYREEDK